MPGMRDIVNNVDIGRSLAPAARTAAANGATVDTRGYDSVMFECEFGAVADGYFEFAAEDSPNDSDWTAVAAANLDGSFPTAFGGSPATGVNTIGKVGYKGTARYVRITLAQGLSPAPVTGCLARGSVLLGKHHRNL